MELWCISQNCAWKTWIPSPRTIWSALTRTALCWLPQVCVEPIVVEIRDPNPQVIKHCIFSVITMKTPGSWWPDTAYLLTQWRTSTRSTARKHYQKSWDRVHVIWLIFDWILICTVYIGQNSCSYVYSLSICSSRYSVTVMNSRTSNWESMRKKSSTRTTKTSIERQYGQYSMWHTSCTCIAS